MKKNAIIILMCCSLTAWGNDLESMKLAGKVKSILQETRACASVAGKSVVSDAIESKWTCTFDVRGNMIDEVTYYKDGTPSREYVSAFDDSGKKISEEYYDEGELYRETEYTYDAAGKLVAETAFDDSGWPIYGVSYSYDFKKNIVMREESSRSDVQCTWVDFIDSRGNKAKSLQYDGEGSLMDQYLYTYDNAGNVIRESIYERDGTLRFERVWLYEYGADGNWKKRTECDVSGSGTAVPKSVASRVIKYY